MSALNGQNKVTHGALFAIEDEMKNDDWRRGSYRKFLRSTLGAIEELLDSDQFPQFMRQNMEEKIYAGNLSGSDLRGYFQSCGLPIPADLRGI